MAAQLMTSRSHAEVEGQHWVHLARLELSPFHARRGYIREKEFQSEIHESASAIDLSFHFGYQVS